MKNLMLMMSLIVLVACNGKESEGVRRALEQEEYTQEEVDALNCNEEVLGWAAEVPGSLQAAQQSLEQNPEYQGCGHFDIYIDEVIYENPGATYLRKIEVSESEAETETTEEDTLNDLTPEQVEALNCNEDFLGWASEAPASLEAAKKDMKANPGYKQCGHFDVYIDEVIHANPEISFLRNLK